jgi:hypothetical protein
MSLGKMCCILQGLIYINHDDEEREGEDQKAK